MPANLLPPHFFSLTPVNAQGQETNRSRQQAHYFTENLGNGVSLEMVAIPGGTFLMGSPETEQEPHGRESPQHKVTVKPFFMGRYPVTQAQWRVVAALPKVKHDLNPNPSYIKGDNRPVEQVSWYDAVEFCARLSQQTGREYRLPSEAEWEYACRAGTTTPFHFGETITTDLANHYGKSTSPVGSFQVANAFGLFDMHGNVWEWCADYWHSNYQGAPTDGSAWLNKNDNDYQSRILRGGSWFNGPYYCRSASRFNGNAGLRFCSIGFRVVCGEPRTL
jgi:formylglycine-generating enzyme required for sulfatase activity